MAILKNTYLASVGIYNLTRQKAEKVIDSLIKAGEIPPSDRKQAVLELLDKAEKQTAEMKVKVLKEAGRLRKDASTTMDKVKLATKKDLELLSKKLDQLAKKLGEKA